MAAILYEKEGGIATITINRAEAMNALNFETTEELANVWLDFRDDPQLLVAIVTGAGEKTFCAGLDLKESEILTEEPTQASRLSTGYLRDLEIWKPIIAAVNGHALGGGTELALACDIRIAAEKATLGLTEARWGLIPGMGGTQRLPRVVPLGIAMEMLLTGKRISAQEALNLGLVNKVVPSAELMPAAREIARQISECSPVSIRAIKEAVKRGVEMPLEQGLLLETALLMQVLKAPDVKEGFASFQEKRKPQFERR
ncbi:enoyl-CoA hydratase/isomerase family protein [Chloroflexota bacterium]